jgi:bis(5'-nucleosidyl)-tetraphosphatase
MKEIFRDWSKHVIQSYGVIPYRFSASQRYYLVIKQTSGHWGFPKGHAERHESPIVTAARELHEETGLTAELDSTKQFYQNYDVKHPWGKIPKQVGYFTGLTHTDRVTMQPGEVSDYAWLPYAKALERIDHRNSREILEQAESYLNQA